MQLKASWYDNLIAGGLFWLPQLFLAAWMVPGAFSRLPPVIEYINKLSEPAATAFVTAIIALATLVILVTGNLIELMAGEEGPDDIKVFYQHLVLNKHWVEKALENHASYIQYDYDSLTTVIKPRSFWDLTLEAMTSAWLPLLGQKVKVPGLKKGELELSNTVFKRLYALILVRALSKSGDQPSEIIFAPLQTWRLYRIMRGVVTFVMLEVALAIQLGFYVLEIPLLIFLFVPLLLLLVMFIFTSLTSTEFNRVCMVLFSLWYEVEMKEDHNNELLRTPQIME